MSSRPVTVSDLEQMDERSLDLLVERSLWGLDPESENELFGLVPNHDAASAEVDRAVGSLCVGMLGDSGDEALPTDVRTSLATLASSYIASPLDTPAEQTAGTDPELNGDTHLQLSGNPATPVRTASTGLGWVGWLAAAACLGFAVFVSTPESAPTVAAKLGLLEAQAPDLIRASWAGMSAIGAPVHALDKGVSGEIIWSDDRDEGYMRISGIEANDPSEFQYQLWIFDAGRRIGDLPQFKAAGLPDLLTQRPVDGGVFDVTVGKDGSCLIPVDAKLPVGEAKIFAVTKERPGGVVVSDREIVFLALRG